MTDPTAEFFRGLGRRGHEPLLHDVSGAIRLDVERDERTDHWLVKIRNGEVQVSTDNEPADVVIGVEGGLADEIVTGQANAMAQLLRGSLMVDGDPEMLVRFQRIFPGPLHGHGRQPVTSVGGEHHG
jgi:hypothetical protein